MDVFCLNNACKHKIENPRDWNYCPFCGQSLSLAKDRYVQVRTILNRLASMEVIKGDQIDTILRNF